MMWPFTKKEKEIEPEVLRAFLEEDKPLLIPTQHFLAKGGELRRACTLKEKLMANRIAQKKGSGEAYWNSVVRVVEEHYGIRKQI